MKTVINFQLKIVFNRNCFGIRNDFIIKINKRCLGSDFNFHHDSQQSIKSVIKDIRVYRPSDVHDKLHNHKYKGLKRCYHYLVTLEIFL